MHHEEIAAEPRAELVLHLRARIEERGVHRRILMHGHRVGRARSAVLRVSGCGHEDGLHLIAARLSAELALLDARLEAAP